MSGKHFVNISTFEKSQECSLNAQHILTSHRVISFNCYAHRQSYNALCFVATFIKFIISQRRQRCTKEKENFVKPARDHLLVTITALKTLFRVYV